MKAFFRIESKDRKGLYRYYYPTSEHVHPRPGPHNDLLLRGKWNNLNQEQEHYYFGFASLRQAFDWMSLHDWRGASLSNETLSFNLYFVPELIAGETQAVCLGCHLENPKYSVSVRQLVRMLEDGGEEHIEKTIQLYLDQIEC